jgi:hypothetical protein
MDWSPRHKVDQLEPPRLRLAFPLTAISILPQATAEHLSPTEVVAILIIDIEGWD